MSTTRRLAAILAADIADYSAAMEREQAMQQLERALRISPVDPSIYHVETAIAYAQFFLHRFDQALHWTGKALARRPAHLLALRVACWSHVMVGDLKKAEAMLSASPTIGARSISAARQRLIWRRQDDIDLWCDAMRRVGIPE